MGNALRLLGAGGLAVLLGQAVGFAADVEPLLSRIKAVGRERARDQVDLIAKQLKALGVDVDLAAHFGFIQRWQLVGPFDNTDGAGFAKLFPPEKAVDLAATFKGKKEASLTWSEHTTADPYGL